MNRLVSPCPFLVLLRGCFCYISIFYSNKFCMTAIAKSLNILPDEPADTPRTAKRKFEQESDDEEEEEDDGSVSGDAMMSGALQDSEGT